jgi:hypothetical protein
MKIPECAAKTLDEDQLTRVSLLIGIYKALNILYSERLADAWMLCQTRIPCLAGTRP